MACGKTGGVRTSGKCRRGRPSRLSRPRKGSGTIVGTMLVLLAAALLGALMTGSSLVIRRSEARQEADLAALSAADARAGLLPGSPPCGRAASVLALARPSGSASATHDGSALGTPGGSASGTHTGPGTSDMPVLVSCRVEGQDAVVTVRVGSGPLSALTQTSARAGPDECGGRKGG